MWRIKNSVSISRASFNSVDIFVVKRVNCGFDNSLLNK